MSIVVWLDGKVSSCKIHISIRIALGDQGFRKP
jgi:hypothetical protein